MPAIDRSLSYSVYTCRRLIGLSLVAGAGRTDPQMRCSLTPHRRESTSNHFPPHCNSDMIFRQRFLTDCLLSKVDARRVYWRLVMDAAADRCAHPQRHLCFVYTYRRLIDLSLNAGNGRTPEPRRRFLPAKAPRADELLECKYY